MTFKQEWETMMKSQRIEKNPSAAHQYEMRWAMLDKFKTPRSASQLEKAIVGFLKMKGHQAAKTEVKGTYKPPQFQETALGRLQVRKGSYIKTGAAKGQADIASAIYGCAVHWEVKFSKSDRQSADQKRFEKHVTEAGGFYFIVRNVDEFYQKYNQLMEHPRIVLMKDYEQKNGSLI
jgi:hypothetical protein